jgi:hypothetical protein
MNPRLNKKVKKDLDAYFKGFRGSDPEVHHGVKHILIGALRDANFHSEAKKVDSMFPKAKQSKYAGRKDLEDSIEQNHGEPIAKAAKWDGHDIIDAVAFFVSMFIGGPVGAKVSSLKEGMNENFRSFVNQYIKEVTHSYDYETMSGTRENETDKEEIKIGEYQTKYFHVCPTASTLYGDIESKGVDMDMAERSVRLLDALFFIEEHIQREGYTPERDYVMVAKNIAKNIMKMGTMMGLEKEHSFVQGHVDTIIKSVEGKKLEERVIELTEENKPTNPELWSRALAAARAKYDVYPSAYANAFASKWYKEKGGGWRKSESIDEAKSMDTKKKLKVYDKLKKGDEITIKYGSSMSSGREGKFKVTKGKTVVGKQKVERIILQNVANPKGVKYYLYQRNGNVTMAIGDMAASIEDISESVNESMIGIQTKANFKPNSLKGALERAGIKGFQMNRLSVTLTALKLDKKDFETAKKIIDTLPKAKIQMAKESVNEANESINEYYVENFIDTNEIVEYLKENSVITEAEYQGRKVELNKIMQGDVKKFKVYVNNPKGNVVKVNFGHGGSSAKKSGEKTMSIRKNNPGARKAFRARHNCDNPGPKHKARYWSCRKW